MDEPTSAVSEVSPAPQSPVAPGALRQLLFAPSVYFRSASLDEGPAWLILAWISGMASVIDRVDQRLLRADIGSANSAGSGMSIVTEDWASFWGLMLSFGMLWAFWNWWAGGLWYRMRLRLSGASEPNPRQARLVYTFAGLIVNVPTVLFIVAFTIGYPNYRAAWEADSNWSLLIVVCLVWSTVVSWRGVLATFPVRPSRALWWFLILPLALYFIVYGVVVALLADAYGG